MSVEAPTWIPRFGHNLRKIVLVDVADRDDPEEYLAALAALPAFETLVVGGPQFGDQQLRRLHGRQILRSLVLDCTDVTDAVRGRLGGVVGLFVGAVAWAIQRTYTQ